MHQVKIFQTTHAFTSAAAELVVELAETAIRERGEFSMVLSGGSTPAPVYQALGAEPLSTRLDWQKIYLFWGDERHMPPDNPESNFFLAQNHLLGSIGIPGENVHRVPSEMEVRLAAFSYEESLRAFFDGEWPRFDLVLLGMGEDGHTASLFPYTAGLNEEFRWFIANYVPQHKTWRLTLSKNAINAARHIVVLVCGSSKAETLKEVLAGAYDPYQKPIQFIAPVDGVMTWLADDEAAGLLPEEQRVPS